MTGHGDVLVSVSGRSDVGRVRTENQDRLLVVDLDDPGPEPPQEGATSVDPIEFALGGNGAILFVADGVGGKAGGSKASRLAAAEVHRRMVADVPADGSSPEVFVERLVGSVDQANSVVHAEAGRDVEASGMATTATLVGLFRGHAYAAQVGDSRAYLIRGSSIGRLTRDQSLVQDLIDSGVLSEDDSHGVADNMILQALGPSAAVRPALTFHELRRGDLILLCSDGLSSVVSDAEMCLEAAQTPDPSTLCDALVGLANSRGGPDNITVLVARVDGDGLAEPGDSKVVQRQAFEARPA